MKAYKLPHPLEELDRRFQYRGRAVFVWVTAVGFDQFLWTCLIDDRQVLTSRHAPFLNASSAVLAGTAHAKAQVDRLIDRGIAMDAY